MLNVFPRLLSSNSPLLNVLPSVLPEASDFFRYHDKRTLSGNIQNMNFFLCKKKNNKRVTTAQHPARAPNPLLPISYLFIFHWTEYFDLPNQYNSINVPHASSS